MTGNASNLVQIPTDLAANSGCPFLGLQQASLSADSHREASVGCCRMGVSMGKP